MLLEHQQAMKGELLQYIHDLRSDTNGLSRRMDRLELKVDRGFAEAAHRFEEARQHRQALQEDLEATMRTQFTHKKQLAVLTGQSLSDTD